MHILIFNFLIKETMKNIILKSMLLLWTVFAVLSCDDLLEEKEANREMKLIKGLANKKILLSFIIGVFLLVTIFVNFISNSIDGIFLLLAGGESKVNILFNLFIFYFY